MTDDIRARAVALYDAYTLDHRDRRTFMRQMTLLAGSAAAASALVATITPSPAAAASGPANAREPLVLKDQGSFYVGGRKVTLAQPASAGVEMLSLGAGIVVRGQMFVEYQIPAREKPGAWPIVFIHGGGLSGSNWDTTPDGREGWKTHFLRKGYPVYVVDQVGSGRSGRELEPDRTEGQTAGPAPGVFNWTREAAWKLFRFGPAPGRPHPGLQFPIEAEDQLLAQAIPHMGGFTAAPTQHGLEALLDRIGPAILLGFSAGGRPVAPTIRMRPDLVKAAIMIEPGHGAGVTAGDAPIVSRVPFLYVYGDYIVGADDPFWQPLFDESRASTAIVKAHGGHAKILLLPEMGIRGNSHMLMQELNNLEIADLIVNWIDTQVARKA